MPKEKKKVDPNFIRLFTGKKFYPLDPDPKAIDIRDIAHALSNLCRYSGHSRSFYSVAEHSVHVYDHMKASPVTWARDVLAQGLLHDASEAYLVDVVRPVKKFLPKYRKFEDKLQRVINKKFGLPEKMCEAVHSADNNVLLKEANILMGGHKGWNVKGIPSHVEIWCLPPQQAEIKFLSRYYELFE